MAAMSNATATERKPSGPLPLLPHREGCPCQGTVTITPGTEAFPCPALWDAYSPGSIFGPPTAFDRWRVAHKMDRAGEVLRVWSSWERVGPTA